MFANYYRKTDCYKAIQLVDDVRGFLTSCNDGRDEGRPLVVSTGTAVVILSESNVPTEIKKGTWIVLDPSGAVVDTLTDQYFRKEYVPAIEERNV
jgi:hypothetical protein